MKRFFRNLNWKNILIISLALVLGVGAIAGVSSIVKNEKTTLSSLEFKRGALNDDGFYTESDLSIYTKDLIECQGLEIEPDFEVSGTYEVFYYDLNKQFLDSTGEINAQTDGVYVKGASFALAKYCRIVITPDIPRDEDGHLIEDYKIKFYEVSSIASKYKISVDKEQKFNISKINILSNVEIYEGKSNAYNLDYTSNHQDHEDHFCTDAIDVVSFSQLKIVVPAGGDCLVVFYDSEGKNVDPSTMHNFINTDAENEKEYVVDILDNTYFIGFNINKTDVAVSEYGLYLLK